MTAIVPVSSFAISIEERSGQPIRRCYQCMKCSAGCPMAFAMDIPPHQVVRLVQLGARARLSAAQTPWVCTGCKTCQARCPNGIDLSKVNDALKAAATAARVAPGDRYVAAFHSSFMSSVRALGRSYELGMIGLYKLRSGTYTADLTLGLTMLRKGKLKLLPKRIHHLREVEGLFRRAAGADGAEGAGLAGGGGAASGPTGGGEGMGGAGEDGAMGEGGLD